VKELHKVAKEVLHVSGGYAADMRSDEAMDLTRTGGDRTDPAIAHYGSSLLYLDGLCEQARIVIDALKRPGK
jgi:hypothetical protein